MIKMTPTKMLVAVTFLLTASFASAQHCRKIDIDCILILCFDSLTGSPRAAVRYLQDHETLLCAQHIGHFTGLQ